MALPSTSLGIGVSKTCEEALTYIPRANHRGTFRLETPSNAILTALRITEIAPLVMTNTVYLSNSTSYMAELAPMSVAQPVADNGVDPVVRCAEPP